MMLQRWFFTVLLLVTLPASLAAQERYLVAYAGFAGFQAPVWAPKDLGLMAKYGFNGDVVLVPGSVRQIQALQGGSIHFAQADAATAINAINQGHRLYRTVVTRHQRGAPGWYARARGYERNERSVVSHERHGRAPLVRGKEPGGGQALPAGVCRGNPPVHKR